MCGFLRFSAEANSVLCERFTAPSKCSNFEEGGETQSTLLHEVITKIIPSDIFFVILKGF